MLKNILRLFALISLPGLTVMTILLSMQNRQSLNRRFAHLIETHSLNLASPHPLLTLFQEPPAPNLLPSTCQSILEVGCGARSVLEDLSLWPEAERMAMDLSDRAIEYASQRGSNRVEYFQGNLLELNFLHAFDVVVDGHCLHTLSLLAELELALKGIHRSLRPGGLLLWESMVAHSKMALDPCLSYDGEAHLLKEGKPFRILLKAFDMEKLVLENGFKIEYFSILGHRRMIPVDDREVPLSGDPEVLRMILRG